MSSAFGASTLESHDSRLAGALLKVRSKRTPEHLVAAGDRYAQLGVRDTAMDYYSASLAIDPRYAPALDGAARIWRDWGQFGPALGDASRAIYFAPRSPEAWNTLGTVLQVLGEMEGAAAAYRKSVTLDSSAAYARSNLCYLSFLQGHAADARDACSAAVDADGQFVHARNNLALIHAAAGDTAAAFEAFQTAGGKAVAHYNLGIVLLAGRRYDEAVRAFEAAYRLDPSFDRAHGRARYARRQALAARESTHGRR
jgi:Flp pilus assembly protein TadD